MGTEGEVGGFSVAEEDGGKGGVSGADEHCRGSVGGKVKH